MGTCPECKFDGTQELPEDRKFPHGFCQEKRIKLKQEKINGISRAVHDLDKNGRPQWVTRGRCPACGHTENVSSKPKVKKEVEE